MSGIPGAALPESWNFTCYAREVSVLPGKSVFLLPPLTLDLPARRETYWRGSISGKKAVGCTRTTAGAGEGRFSRLDPQAGGGESGGESAGRGGSWST